MALGHKDVKLSELLHVVDGELDVSLNLHIAKIRTVHGHHTSTQLGAHTEGDAFTDADRKIVAHFLVSSVFPDILLLHARVRLVRMRSKIAVQVEWTVLDGEARS